MAAVKINWATIYSEESEIEWNGKNMKGRAVVTAI